MSLANGYDLRTELERTAEAARSGKDFGRAEFRRASGACICPVCGKEYRQHPLGGPVGWQDEQFLNELCNGDLVKL